MFINVILFHHAYYICITETRVTWTTYYWTLSPPLELLEGTHANMYENTSHPIKVAIDICG